MKSNHFFKRFLLTSYMSEERVHTTTATGSTAVLLTAVLRVTSCVVEGGGVAPQCLFTLASFVHCSAL